MIITPRRVHITCIRYSTRFTQVISPSMLIIYSNKESLISVKNLVSMLLLLAYKKEVFFSVQVQQIRERLARASIPHRLIF